MKSWWKAFNRSNIGMNLSSEGRIVILQKQQNKKKRNYHRLRIYIATKQYPLTLQSRNKLNRDRWVKLQRTHSLPHPRCRCISSVKRDIGRTGLLRVQQAHNPRRTALQRGRAPGNESSPQRLDLLRNIYRVNSPEVEVITAAVHVKCAAWSHVTSRFLQHLPAVELIWWNTLDLHGKHQWWNYRESVQFTNIKAAWKHSLG